MEKKCTVLKNQTTECWIKAEVPMSWIDYRTLRKQDNGKFEWEDATADEIGDTMEEKCKEFIEFLRDHRSRDNLSLEVVREKKDLCSVCKDRWEPDEQDGVVCCACCGAELEATEPLPAPRT